MGIAAGVWDVIIPYIMGFAESRRLENDEKILHLDLGSAENSLKIRNITTFLNDIQFQTDVMSEEDKKRFLVFDCDENFPINDETFDIITAMDLIEHLENPWHLMRECRRILKDDGILTLSTPNILSPFSQLEFIRTNYFQLFKEGHMYLETEKVRNHINPIASWEINFIAKDIGLTPLIMTYNNNLQDNIIYIFKKSEPFDTRINPRTMYNHRASNEYMEPLALMDKETIEKMVQNAIRKN